MTLSAETEHWSLTCRDVGYSCEWRVRATSLPEITARYRDHAKCAHAASDAVGDLLLRAESAARRE